MEFMLSERRRPSLLGARMRLAALAWAGGTQLKARVDPGRAGHGIHSLLLQSRLLPQGDRC